MKKQSVFTIFLALVGIVSMSSAVVAFSYITSVGPITKSAWRLQITTICFGGCLALPLKRGSMFEAFKKYYFRTLISGLSIGSHFVLWNVSMLHTSVAHSLVFLYSCPILLVCYYFAIKKALKRFQIFGAVLGFSGLGLMCFMSSSNEGTTWYGDLISLCGALALCVNLVMSERPMNEFPLPFLFGIHLVSAVFCTILSISLEKNDRSNFWDFLYQFQGIYAAYLGIVCGFIGNGAFYLLLKRVDPFVVSVIINFDPVVGSFFAWVFGILTTPGVFTLVGGALVVIGNLIATAVNRKNTIQGDENLEVKSVSGVSNENGDMSCAIEIKIEKSEGVSETCQMN